MEPSSTQPPQITPKPISPGEAPDLAPKALSDPAAKDKKMLIILVILLLVFVGLIAVIVSRRNQSDNLQPTVTPTPTVTTTPTGSGTVTPTATPSTTGTTTPTPTTDPTANWKTYNNTVHKYSIKYSNDWVIDASTANYTKATHDNEQADLTFTRGQYKIVLSRFFFGWDGLYCRFTDSMQTANQSATFVELGTAVELGTEFDARRNKDVITGNDYHSLAVTFRVCTKTGQTDAQGRAQYDVMFGDSEGTDNNYFSGIVYVTPTTPDQAILKEMDLMVQSIKLL